MNNLLYIGSPQFDGIGILNTEAQKIQKYDSITILDGIIPGAYPEINNFSYADYILWILLRKRQFIRTLKPDAFQYLHAEEIINCKKTENYEIIHKLLEQAISDHCVCNNIAGQKIADYKKQNWMHQYNFLCNAYEGLQELFRTKNFTQVTLFNGRNTLAKLLVIVADEQSVPVRWLEYFGKRDSMMTYIASPVDIFDFDAMSEYIYQEYKDCTHSGKDSVAQDCLSDRVNSGDPLLAKWGVDFSAIQPIQGESEKQTVAFFFSSEDEYPAVKPSIYGFNPPIEQYNTFLRICEAVIGEGLHHKYRFLVKLHPRYAVEKTKLDLAKRHWDSAINMAKQLGINLEIIDPLASAYKVIAEASIVFSYGSTAWEATFLGKPAVLMGPNLFATHDCVYIASSVDDVVNYLKCLPEPKPVHTCYPYAWAWRELGHKAQPYLPRLDFKWIRRIGNVFSNRFSRHQYVE